MDQKERLQSESLSRKRTAAIIFYLIYQSHPVSVLFSGTYTTWPLSSL